MLLPLNWPANWSIVDSNEVRGSESKGAKMNHCANLTQVQWIAHLIHHCLTLQTTSRSFSLGLLGWCCLPSASPPPPRQPPAAWWVLSKDVHLPPGPDLPALEGFGLSASRPDAQLGCRVVRAKRCPAIRFLRFLDVWGLGGGFPFNPLKVKLLAGIS